MRNLFLGIAAMIAFQLGATSLAWAGSNPWSDSYALERAGKYAQAVSSINVVLGVSPNNEFALMRRAWLNYLQGQFNAAMDDYNQVLGKNPKSIEARLGLTLPLMAQQRWREAASEANKAIEVSAWDYTAHLRVLVCQEALHDWANLARHAQELSEHYPTDTTALVYLARAEAWQNNVNGAKAAYTKVLERFPGHLEAEAYIKKNP